MDKQINSQISDCSDLVKHQSTKQTNQKQQNNKKQKPSNNQPTDQPTTTLRLKKTSYTLTNKVQPATNGNHQTTNQQ